MSWEISKEFNFEMGHRVWAQKLSNPELSISTDCACKHLHGHSYTIKVCLKADDLDQSSMVTDFKNLNFMKKFVDEVLDHKFMIDVNDPNFNRITGVNPSIMKGVSDFVNLGHCVIVKGVSEEAKNEQTHLDSFVLVNFVPTSENICKNLKDYAQGRIGHIATVSAVELWETKKSFCRYE